MLQLPGRPGAACTRDKWSSVRPVLTRLVQRCRKTEVRNGQMKHWQVIRLSDSDY